MFFHFSKSKYQFGITAIMEAKRQEEFAISAGVRDLKGLVQRKVVTTNTVIMGEVEYSIYRGLIVAKSEDGTGLCKYKLGIASLLNVKELLPEDNLVSQIENFALNAKSNKQKQRLHVEVVKGQFGFLSYS